MGSRSTFPKPRPDVFSSRQWSLAHGRTLTLGPKGLLMGILNVTPDSFSDGGQFSSVDHAVAQAVKMVADGAHIIDIGAESTRPGAGEIDGAEERRRLLPVLEAVLSALPDAVISVDTYRAETAEAGIEAGAHIVNDVWGLQRDREIADVAARTGAGIVAMHTNREREADGDVIADQLGYFARTLDIAGSAGVSAGQVVLDPGFGFGKDTDHNVELMARFSELLCLGYPLLAGTSRKRFIGAISGRDVGERDIATAASTAILRLAGACVLRVHDVAINRDALAVSDAMIAHQGDKAVV